MIFIMIMIIIIKLELGTFEPSLFYSATKLKASHANGSWRRRLISGEA